ncbi:MAG: hypothetical protein V1693_03750 [Nanoarchaeota archaeon]|nr:hypothetical protein [Nanoarchaeota archaeon]
MRYILILLSIIVLVSVSGCTTPSGYCGDGEVQQPNSDGVFEECDGYNEACESGLCNDDCKCQDILGAFCGDGETQQPNDYGIMEECDGSDEDCSENEICGSDCFCHSEKDENNNTRGNGPEGPGFYNGYCGDDTMQRPNSNGFWEECDGSNEGCGSGWYCGGDCLCHFGQPGTGGGGDCGEDKILYWTKYCLPAITGVEYKFYNEDGTAGWVACIPITLQEAHNRGYCQYIQTVDPACDTWEGCNAKECHVFNCEHDKISCVTYIHHYMGEIAGIPICKTRMTHVCQYDCNCEEDKDAVFIKCPDIDCEDECPFISASIDIGGSTISMGGDSGGDTGGDTGGDDSGGDSGGGMLG